MSLRNTLESTAGDIAEKVRDSADDWMEKIGAESRHLGQIVGERVSERVEDLPSATLKRLNLITTSRARRRIIFGVIIGLVAGAVIANRLATDRRHAVISSRKDHDK